MTLIRRKQRNIQLFLKNYLLWAMFLLVTPVHLPCCPDACAAANATAIDVMLVLDNSGSMKRSDPEFQTKTFVMDFIKKVPQSTAFGIIIFDDQINRSMPLTLVTDETFPKQLQASLNQIDYSGLLTRSPSAIERAIYELKHSGRENTKKVIVFLTDGIVDSGDKQQDKEQTKWLTDILTEDARLHGIQAFCIAFTEQADFQLIQTFAQRTDGEYFRAYEVGEIQGIFEKILDLISAPEKALSTISIMSNSQTKKTPQPLQALPFRPETLAIIAAAALLTLIFIVLMIRRQRKSELILQAHLQQLKALEKRQQANGKKPSKPAPKPWIKIDRERLMSEETTHDMKIDDDELLPVISEPEETLAGEIFPEPSQIPEPLMPAEDAPPQQPAPPAPEPTVTLQPEPALPDSADAIIQFPETNQEDGLPKAQLQDILKVTDKSIHSITKKSMNIGRKPEVNDIVIPNKTISKQHARIDYRNGMFYLTDLRSANGTYLNHVLFSDHHKMQEVAIKSGDKLTFDKFEFLFLYEDEDRIDRTIMRHMDISDFESEKRLPLGVQSSPTVILSPEMIASAIKQPGKKSKAASSETPSGTSDRQDQQKPRRRVKPRVRPQPKPDQPSGSIPESQPPTQSKAETPPKQPSDAKFWETPDIAPINQDPADPVSEKKLVPNTGPMEFSTMNEVIEIDDFLDAWSGDTDDPSQNPKQDILQEMDKIEVSKCFNHPDNRADNFCVICGYTFCSECITEKDGHPICRDCLSINQTGELKL